MSFEILNRVAFLWDALPDPWQFRALVILAQHADKNAICFPSVGRLAALMDCTPRHAQRALAALEAGAWIVCVGNARGGAPGQTKRYRIFVSRLPTGDEPVAPRRRDRGKRATRRSPAESIGGTTNDPLDGRPAGRRRATDEVDTGDRRVAQTSNEAVNGTGVFMESPALGQSVIPRATMTTTRATTAR